MKSVKIFCFCLLISVLSCSTEESTIRLPFFETPVLTGFQLRDANGQKVGEIGIPNIHLSRITASKNDPLDMVCYPNPAIEYIAIYTSSRADTPKYLWLVRGDYNSGSSDYTPTLGSLTIGAGGSPIIQLEFSRPNPVIDVRDLPSGYYRVYVQMDDEIFFDNIIKY